MEESQHLGGDLVVKGSYRMHRWCCADESAALGCAGLSECDSVELR